MEPHINEQAEESASAAQSSETADDQRATIEGEASLVGPPLLRKLEHLSVNTTSNDPPLPAVENMASVRAAPSPPAEGPATATASAPAVIPRGSQTPDGNRRSPAAGNSPSTSQVSVGSVAPTLVAAALMPRHHYDLTPVTRNTERYVDDRDEPKNNIVSPEDELHGEHLALPSSFVSTAEGPTLPPLQSTLNEQMLWEHHVQMQEQQLDAPIQFPSRKSYTFTSREQYEEDLQREQPSPLSDHLRPYQPSRQEDLEGVGSIPAEAVSQIFNRRIDEESHANHRFLRQPFPLEERQASIPSLHLAHPLQGSNTHSFTDHTTEGGDDEESLQYVGQDDGDSLDASLSSRTSSLYLPDETAATPHPQPPQDAPILSLAPAHHADTVVMEELSRVMADDTHRKRKRRQQKRAMADWLETLTADPEQLAEAASSKFLTGKTGEGTGDLAQTKQARRQTLPIRTVVSDEQQADG